MKHMGKRIDYYLSHRIKDQLTVGVIVFAEIYGILCATGPALLWLVDKERKK
jgi:hypothetical protein